MLSLMKVFLDKIMVDLLNVEQYQCIDSEDNTDNVSQLLRLMLFAKLFHMDNKDPRNSLLSNMPNKMM